MGQLGHAMGGQWPALIKEAAGGQRDESADKPLARCQVPGAALFCQATNLLAACGGYWDRAAGPCRNTCLQIQTQTQSAVQELGSLLRSCSTAYEPSSVLASVTRLPKFRLLAEEIVKSQDDV